MTQETRIATMKKQLEALKPGFFLQWRSREKHNAGQTARTKRYRAKKKAAGK